MLNYGINTDDLRNKWLTFAQYSCKKFKLGVLLWSQWCNWYLVEYKKMKCKEILR